MRSRSRHRALTLIEVLAATVLLTLLSTLCITLLRQAGATPSAAGRDDSAFDMIDLERFADAVLADPDNTSLREDSDFVDLTLVWPDAPDRPSVQVRSATTLSLEENSTHRWIAFTCGELVVWRWLELPRPEPSP